MALQEYKCPCCGGGIQFDSSLQKMKCPYCETEFELDALEGYNSELNNQQGDSLHWDTSDAGSDWQPEEENGLHRYLCSSCGAEIYGDAAMGATKCPYCDNPIVLTQQFAGDLMPDLIIPFQLDKEAAKQALLKHYQGKRLLPKVFKDQNHIDEIRGIYVPFWLFDADADADMRFRATRVRSWSDRDFDYTETQFYSVQRAGQLAFRDVPVDGSQKIANDLMESIEPFDCSKAVDFKTAYLAGYLADKYDVDAPGSIERANERVRRSTESAFAGTVQGYSTVTPEYSSIRLNHGAAKYALFPVWLLNTSWNGQNYTFAMNGQTGKLVGDLPMDKGLFRNEFLKIGGISAAAVFLLSTVLTLLQ